MLLKLVPAAKSFALLSCAAPAGKTRLSAALGTSPPDQFAAVVHLLFAPTPDPVFVVLFVTVTLRSTKFEPAVSVAEVFGGIVPTTSVLVTEPPGALIKR